VKKGGVIVSIVDEPDKAEMDARGIRGLTLRAAPYAKVLKDLASLIDAKKVNPVVSQTFPLVDFAKALDQIATRHTVGRSCSRWRQNQAPKADNRSAVRS
jgi:NADPH:quinone reductase-like Zn-dependent oxidoreductase